jgi:hypothetical protein
MPTFLDVTGTDRPEVMHGHSLAPILKGEKTEWQRTYSFSGPGLAVCEPEENHTLWHAVQNDRFKLHIPSHKSGEPELYAAGDTAESDNIISSHTEEARTMLKGFIEFCESHGASQEKVEFLNGIGF